MNLNRSLRNGRQKYLSVIFPGRASSTPTTDLFITLMSLGVQGYKNLVQERKSLFQELKTKLTQVAEKHGERLLETKGNPISMGKSFSVDVFPEPL